MKKIIALIILLSSFAFGQTYPIRADYVTIKLDTAETRAYARSVLALKGGTTDIVTLVTITTGVWHGTK